MPQYYTIDTKNPFEGFANEAASSDSEAEGGGPILSKEKAPSVAAAAAAAEVATSAEVSNTQAATATGSGKRPARRNPPQGNGEERPPRGPRRGPRPAGERNSPAQVGTPLADEQAWPVENEEARAIVAGEQQNASKPAGTRAGGARGRAAARGGRQGADYDPKHRDFDRRSGTGRGREVKKGGGGAHSWGNEAEDFGASPTEAASKEPIAERPQTGSEPASDKEGAATGEPAAVEQPQQPAPPAGPSGITLTAYRKQQAESRAAMPDIAPVHEVPKAEKETKKLEKEGYVMYRKNDDEDQSSAPAAATHTDAAPKKGQNKVVMLESLGGEYGGRRGRGGRGGRPGSNGTTRPPRDENAAAAETSTNGGASARKAINLTDSDAFPTLASS